MRMCVWASDVSYTLKASHFPCDTKALQSQLSSNMEINKIEKFRVSSIISILKSGRNRDTRSLGLVSVFRCLGQPAGVQKVCPFPLHHSSILHSQQNVLLCCSHTTSANEERGKVHGHSKKNKHIHIFL